MNTVHIAFIESPFGRVGAASDGQSIVRVSLPNEDIAGSVTHNDPLLRDALDQLREFLEGTRRVFDIPLRPAGTPFFQRVWSRLTAIPYGQTLTYGELAADLGTHARAIGMACARNPIPLIIPCHRVVGAKSLTGFRGGLDLKRLLLEREQN